MAISIQAQMASLNGGIPMWIPKLADFLAVNGVERFINESMEEAENFQDKHWKNHLHFLISGLKSIDPTELAAAVAPLAEYPARLRALEAQWKEQSKALENLNEEWRITTASAKTHIVAWQKWASATEAEARKEALPWLRSDSWLDMSVGFELSGAHSVLSSPHCLARQEIFFNEKISAIRAVVERSYVNGVFDAALIPADLDDAIHKLIIKQQEVIECEAVLKEIKVEWEKCSDSYTTHRSPLIKMLWLMPLSGRVALFWLCRPELEYSSLKNV